jgi:hypothetical protein
MFFKLRHTLFVKSKEIYFRIHGLKEKHCQVTDEITKKLLYKNVMVNFSLIILMLTNPTYSGFNVKTFISFIYFLNSFLI